jgi:serine/threonine protein kinase
METSLIPREAPPYRLPTRICGANPSDGAPALPAVESFEESLFACQIKTEDGKFFIPEGTIDHLDEDKIRSVIEESLSTLPKDTASEYATRVCQPEQSFRKIFAVLVLSDMIENIVCFVNLGIDDSYLPMPDPRPFDSNDFPSISTTRMPHKKWNQVFNNRRSRRLNFFRAQWTVLSPVFQSIDLVKHFSFSNDYILPFLSIQSGTSSDLKSKENIVKDQTRYGGYSEVRRIKIHPAHVRFGDYGVSSPGYYSPRDVMLNLLQVDNPDHVFALKRLDAHDDYELWQEVATLKRFRNMPHIIQLLATFEVNEDAREDSLSTYYLIFPWANGDLESLWETKGDFVADSRIAPWISKQSSALAEALSKIHNDDNRNTTDPNRLYGRHGDIKPSNILWFSTSSGESSIDLGHLVLSDFGLCDFRSEESRSALPTSAFARSAKYRAPEFDIEDGKISRSTDIWMLGCTFLEFVTWYLMGVDAVMNDFQKTRLESDIYGIDADTFFRIVDIDGRRTGIVKPQVASWIASLHEHGKCSDYIHDFLELIEQHMLVADPKNKWTAAEVSHRLNEHNNRCQDNDQYYRVENPWTGRKTSPKSQYGVEGQHDTGKTMKMALNTLFHRKASDQRDQRR